MKYAIGIVTYQPDNKRLRENITSAFDNELAGHLIIVDNHSLDSAVLRQLVTENEHIVLIENDDNLGIAHALNQICNQALTLGYEWVVTLDQDSVMQPHILDEYDKYTSRPELGIICPRIEDRNMGRQYARSSNGAETIQHCITAGNLVRLQAWKVVGGFTEELFIDGVDFDFCLKLHKHDFQILRTNNVYLLQEVGHGRSIPLPLHHQISILNHSPLRLYYITRNYLSIGRCHQQFFHWVVEILKRMLIVALFEHDKWKKLRFMFKGIRHFWQGKMGKYSPV